MEITPKFMIYAVEIQIFNGNHTQIIGRIQIPSVLLGIRKFQSPTDLSWLSLRSYLQTDLEGASKTSWKIIEIFL